MHVYTAIVRTSGDAFEVTFPDFPECIAEGDTIEKAIQNAHISVCAAALARLSAHHKLPPPTRSYRDGNDDLVVATISVRVPPSRAAILALERTL